MIAMTSKTLPLEPIRGFNNASGDKRNAFCFDLLLENKWTAKQGIGYLYSCSEKMEKETFGCKCNKAWSGLWLICAAGVKLISQNGIHFSWSGRLGSARSKHQPIRCLEELLSASQMAFSGCVLTFGTVNKFPVSCFIGLLLFLFYSGFFRRLTE